MNDRARPSGCYPPALGRSRRTAVALAAVAAALTLNLAPTAAPQASTIVALARTRDAWAHDLHTKQLDSILKFYASDAVFLQPNGERITGPAALRALFEKVMSTYTSEIIFHSQNIETSGDLAYDSGDFEETLTTITTGAKANFKGSYLVVYRRQSKEDWRIVQQAWMGAQPPGT
jgi:ketosteroid isomerase-like protein